MSGEVKIALMAEFLKRSKERLVYQEGAQKRHHKSGEGKTIQFQRYDPLAKATTPLTEGSNPGESNITLNTVQATLGEYGNTVKVSKLLSTTSVDEGDKEKIDLVSQNMAETLDDLTKDALFAGGTVQLANGRAALANIVAGDVFNAAEIKKSVRALENNKALTYEDGFYMGKVNPDTKYDLISDSAWLNAKTYSDVKKLYKGEIGELFGVRFALSTNKKTEASTVTVHSNFIHGANAFGCYDLDKDAPKLYIKQPGDQDTSNPANRYSTISWAGSFVAKVLVAAWVINVKTAASA